MMRPWRLKEVDDTASARLVRELGVHPATARCLVGRGTTDAGTAAAFLRPRLADLRPPEGLPGFGEAVARLVEAVVRGQPVGLFGDYDVDGVTSAALLATFLRAVGGRCTPRVARRDAGYGFGVDDADALVAADCRVVVTVDCGTSDLPAIERARAAGVDVIVVDHHQVPERAEHPAFALLNPHRPDSRYPFRGLASVGLAFFLAAATRTALRAAGWFAGRPEPDVRHLLDLVAVGTVGDMAPLVHENRLLVSAGLRELSARRRPGLDALLDLAGVERGRVLDETTVGWKIGPRLNAPGRLGDAAPALELLLAEDPAQARALAARLEEANDRRRALQDEVAREALEDAAALAGEAAIVVARAGWHPGVVGIVAAKLVDRYARPVAVIALDEASGLGRGSVRTAGDFHVYRALDRCREHLVRYGGHAAAGGLTVEASRVEELRRAFAAVAARGTDESGPTGLPAMLVDALVPLSEVTDRLASELASLGPFGQENPEPLVVARGALVRQSRRVGDGSHLKLTLEGEGAVCSGIAFRLGDRDPGAGATIEVAFRPEISLFRGARRVELRVKDLWPA